MSRARIRVLFLAANPDSTTPLHAGREVRAIRDRLAQAADPHAVEIVERWAVRPGDLQQRLVEVRPHVVHFSGHGNTEYELMLEGEDGSPRPVGKDVLAEHFRLRGEGVRLVVLSACHSLPQAEAVAEHVDCAIGMRRAIGSEAAAALSAALYQGIASGDSIQRAFESARLHLEVSGIAEHRTPQLVVRREGVDPAHIVLTRIVQPAAVASPAPARARDEPPVQPVQNEVSALEKELEAARRRKEKLIRVGAAPDAIERVDGEILGIRRKLRERGQLAVGDALGGERYVLVELLGKGGFATVWRAHDEQTGTDVAIKVLHPQLVRDETRRERFFRGARVMASLRHPGVVRVLDPAGHDRGYDYFVMELVRGGTLREAVVKGRLGGGVILEVLLKVGEALAAAHAAGHVHRDVKPANILLDEEGHPRLTDFDLVGGGETTGGTRTGVLGTIVYAAPEAMVNAADADARADVYGLGMTGVFCYHGKDLPPSVMRDVGKVIRRLSCPEEVRSALARATEWEVEDRWPDVGSFCEALRERAPASGPVRVPERASHVPMAEAAREGLSWATEHGEDSFGRWADFSSRGVTQRMRWIPPGTFQMGSPEGEAGRFENEGPQHRVTLTRGFWLADTPCTQALWEAVMGDNPSRFRSPDRPVEHVSWDDCQEFLKRLNAWMPGLGARLPSEAEWEHACRGGTITATWVGDLDIRGLNDAPILDEIAWYGGNSGVGFELGAGQDSSEWPEKQYPHTRAGTRPVGGKRPNPYGLFDMLGNVYEWCGDLSGAHAAEPRVDPTGPRTGSARVCRGGSWNGFARVVRAARRDADTLGNRSDDLGFRLARGPG